MNRVERIILFSIAIIILLIFYFFNSGFAFIENTPKIIIISVLIMLSFTSLFIEHFFSTPTDILASSIAIILLLIPIQSELNKFGKWYKIYLFYVAFIFLSALIALVTLDNTQSRSSIRNRISAILKDVAVYFGSGKLLFTSLFVITLVFYVDTQSNLFILLALYAAGVLLIDPRKFTLHLFKNLSSKKCGIGEIIGVQSKNIFIAKLFNNHLPVRRFDLVEFNYSIAQTEQIRKGMIIDNYLLNEQQWIKILSSNDLQRIISGKTNIDRYDSNIVYKSELESVPNALNNFVGVVIENSIISRIKFEYASRVMIQEGDLLEIEMEGKKILYQVIEGITNMESLEAKNKAGKIIGEAIQLGIWNNDRLRFEKYGWVPEINTPIFLASEIEDIQLPANTLKIGIIPNTNYPVIFDIEESVTHHLAVLGVTGTGKSVFVRNLIKNMIMKMNNTKVICVDFTNEYKACFKKDEYDYVIKNDKKESLFNAIDILSNELSKFKDKRDLELIREKEDFLINGFEESIMEFISSDKSISIFELPDVENTTGILEYTRWFFKALFILARLGKLEGKRICVVLEEAHTVIPEWNFIGVEEKKAQALVNAIGQIALQGRKYNIGFIVVAQRTANVSKTVLTQCNSIIAFQHFDKTSKDFLSNYMDEKIVDALSSLKFRQACAVGKAFKSGVPIIFEVPEIKEEKTNMSKID